jgi:photosystem II stability/assembly factor-like uncharacterized protein
LNGEKLIMGTRKGVLFAERLNGAWQVTDSAFPGVSVKYAVQDPRTCMLWVATDYGHWGQHLHRSTDGGKSWHEAPVPKYPEWAFVKEDVPATLAGIWTIQPGRQDEPGALYVGTLPGGLFRSTDDGETWELNAGLWNHPTRTTQWFAGGEDSDYAFIHSILPDPRDHKRMLVGISGAGVFETTDGGESWRPINKGLLATFLPNPEAEVGHDPHCMQAAPSNPDILWQQNHCGIFRSTNGGHSWQNVSQEGGPANFGFAIAVDGRDADTAWVVPGISDEVRIAVDGALCVCRTEDGGRNWTRMSNGLPQKNCYDIVFRHALDVRGDAVAFGSTTGNAFVSDDRGDSWVCLGNHLPPVHSVRFVD